MPFEFSADRLSGTDSQEQASKIPAWGVVVVDQNVDVVKTPMTYSSNLYGANPQEALYDAVRKGMVSGNDRVCVFGLEDWNGVDQLPGRTREELRDRWRTLLSRGQFMHVTSLDS